MIMYAMCESYLSRYLSATMLAGPADIKLAHDIFSNQPLTDILTFNDAGDEATIMITGPLSLDGPDFIDRLFGFGGTGYNNIIAAANLVRNNKSIKKTILHMLTPGGTVIGAGETHQAIAELAKVMPVIAENHGQLSSAGYLIAVAAHEIEASSPLAVTGSIGVAVAGIDVSDAMEREGVKHIKIISKNAPNKQADPATVEGHAVIQAEINAMERVFIDTVATGRNTTAEDVIENFGKGAELIARDPDESKPDAISVGMIDSVATVSNGESKPDALGVGKLEGNNMDLTQLKTEHPATFAAAVSEGVMEGAKMERKRVSSHIALGNASGDMKLALKNIDDGTEHDGASNAMYTAAQLNKQAIDAKAADNIGDLDTKNEGEGGVSDLSVALAAKLGVTI